MGTGTGRGLSTVFGIVHSAGGLITLDSRVGGGTRVRIVPPASSGEPTAASPRSRWRRSNDVE
ncbi:hypothetical protein [Gemmatimonas sp.]|uniref:hypothetical protein n=1 Tax=Gemmatimonas sp. TaxID=1962908 RepID=UPI00398340D2